MNVPPWLGNEFGHKYIQKKSVFAKILFLLQIVSADFNVLPKSDNFEASSLALAHGSFQRLCPILWLGSAEEEKIHTLVWTYLHSLFFTPTVEQFWKPASCWTIFCNQYFDISRGSVHTSNILLTLENGSNKSSATAGTIRWQHQVKLVLNLVIRSNFYSTWLSGQTCTQPGSQTMLQ